MSDQTDTTQADTDAVEAAKAESNGHKRTFDVKGQTFEISSRFPLGAALLMAERHPSGVQLFLRQAFGEHYVEAMAAGFDDEDLDRLSEAYRVGPGESRASGGSSRKGGARSRRTSRRSTAST